MDRPTDDVDRLGHPFVVAAVTSCVHTFAARQRTVEREPAAELGVVICSYGRASK